MPRSRLSQLTSHPLRVDTSAALSGMSSETPSSSVSTFQRIEPWLPKSVVCLREGLSKRTLLTELVAGITVGVIALPLAMAFAINSGPGLKPEQGLYTAIIAGFLASLLGGSRVSISGPTGAFMPVLFLIVSKYGYDGLAMATAMAAVCLIVLGVTRLGSLIKYIPYPVTTGFTSGIAVIIAFSQVKDLLGLKNIVDAQGVAHAPPAEFIERAIWYVESIRQSGVNALHVAIGCTGIALIMLVRRFVPRIPGYIVAVIVATGLVWAVHLDDLSWGRHTVETIQSRFGMVPSSLPTLNLGFMSGFADLSKVRELIPAAVTIMMLGGIESLLCCVVADGMIGTRHRSNVELVAQGTANLASVAFGGLPATGAIARTAANVKSGGRTPLSGMIHALFVLACMLLLAPYASHIPMPIFASVLIVVAWNMAEIDHFKSMFRAPRGDVAVLLITFGLTVLVDLTTAVGVGMVLASLLFMKRMTEVTTLGTIKEEINEDEYAIDSKDRVDASKRAMPAGVEVFEINGPFFFGVADRLKDTIRGVGKPPKVFILRMRRVPAIDASALHALEEFHAKCKRQGTRLLLAGVHAQPLFAMTKYGLDETIGVDSMFDDFDEALERAREIVLKQPPTVMHDALTAGRK
jgi:sulfate permease, SulP family